MSTDSTNIFAAALTLPDSERADLAFQLLETLRPPAVMSEDDPQFVKELDRRMANYAAESTAASIDEVTTRIRNALRNRKPS
jgi:putative addiction module component (TIGR02574 family)